MDRPHNTAVRQRGECTVTVYVIVQLKMTDRAAYDRAVVR